MAAAPSVFISYAREDQPRALDLHKKLANAGFNPWLEEIDLVGGEDWDRAVLSALTEWDFVVLCLSTWWTLKRGYLQRELRWALDRWSQVRGGTTYILPVRLDRCELPEELARFQVIDLFEENGWRNLVEALKQDTLRREARSDDTASDRKWFFEGLRELETLESFEPCLQKLRPRINLEPEAINHLLSELTSGILLDALVSGTSSQLTAQHERPPLAKNPVDCTVFAPGQIQRGASGLLQVLVHAPDEKQAAAAMAQKFDPETEERGYRSLLMDAPPGTIFTCEAQVDELTIARPIDTILWTGRPSAAAFGFEVPQRARLGQHVGTVFISKDGVPIGSITFQVQVVKTPVDDKQRPVGKEAHRYRSCFCSYSSLDRAEMLKREQGIRAAGLETFVDAVNLRPGDIWSPKILEAIDRSDLFILIWSSNARKSKWVRKETRYALKRYKREHRPDFRPIPVEGPPIPEVPSDLRAYHFNDERLYLIRAAEIEAATKRKQEREHAP